VFHGKVEIDPNKTGVNYDKTFSRFTMDFRLNENSRPLEFELLKCNKLIFVGPEEALNAMFYKSRRIIRVAFTM
jgi:hypothetical protein